MRTYILYKICVHIQGQAEIPADFAKQLCVEPLAWGTCH
jgi:hypothetical protein